MHDHEDQTARPVDMLADRLNYLFHTVRAAGAPEMSNEDVARRISASGVSCSREYIRLLRLGERNNPTLSQITALAEVFGVPAAYFTDDVTARQIEQQFELVVALRTAGVSHVATRLIGLSPASVAAIGDMVSRVRALEGLQEEPGGEPASC